MVIQASGQPGEHPERTTAAAFPRYTNGEVVADSASLQWPGLFVRRIRFPTRGRSLSGARHRRAVDSPAPSEARRSSRSARLARRGSRGNSVKGTSLLPVRGPPMKCVGNRGSGTARKHRNPPCSRAVPCGPGSGVSRQGGQGRGDRLFRTR